MKGSNNALGLGSLGINQSKSVPNTKSRSRNRLDDYPTFVIEVGVSETPTLSSGLRNQQRYEDSSYRFIEYLPRYHSLNITRRTIRFGRWQNSPEIITRSMRLTALTETFPANLQGFLLSSSLILNPPSCQRKSQPQTGAKSASSKFKHLFRKINALLIGLILKIYQLKLLHVQLNTNNVHLLPRVHGDL